MVPLLIEGGFATGHISPAYTEIVSYSDVSIEQTALPFSNVYMEVLIS